MIVYFSVIIVIFIILCLLAWWTLGVYNVEYPGPNRPDADFRQMIDEFNSFPKELWFRNNSCLFDDYLSCKTSRYIVYESDGTVVYDSVNNREWAGWERNREGYTSAEQLTSSVEYIRACSLTQGVVARGNKLNCLAEMVKFGDFYRIVHVTQYLYDETDPEY